MQVQVNRESVLLLNELLFVGSSPKKGAVLICPGEESHGCSPPLSLLRTEILRWIQPEPRFSVFRASCPVVWRWIAVNHLGPLVIHISVSRTLALELPSAAPPHQVAGDGHFIDIYWL